jgi:hypothetical protein
MPENKHRLSLSKLVSSLVYRNSIFELLIPSLLLRYEHRHLNPFFVCDLNLRTLRLFLNDRGHPLSTSHAGVSQTITSFLEFQNPG